MPDRLADAPAGLASDDETAVRREMLGVVVAQARTALPGKVASCADTHLTRRVAI